MAQDSDQIVVGASGSIYVAAVSTAFPLTPTATPTGFTELGFASDEGITFSDSKETTDIMAWQSFYPVRKIVTAKSNTLAFTLLQWNAATVSLSFGGGDITEVDGYTGIYKYTPPSAEVLDERAMIVDWADGDLNYRICIPRCMVSESVEMAVARTDAAKLPITVTVLADGSEDPWYLLSDDPSLV